LLGLMLAASACAADSAVTPSTDMGGGGGDLDASPGPMDRDATVNDASAPHPDASGSSDAAGSYDTSPSQSPDAGAPEGGTTPVVDASDAATGAPPPRFNVLAIGQLMENGQPEIHAPFVRAATAWLTTLAAQNNFTFTSVEAPDAITDDLLSQYNLILQLNYKPFGWPDTAEAAFEKYLTEGKGGWVGLHHAALYGPEVTPSTDVPWTWFYNFIGQINFVNYIATFAAANVIVEEPTHPIFAGVPSNFIVTTDEWYTWDQSPRPYVHVLSHVDENSYMPPSDIKMGGDHPVIWTNDAYKGRNLYIFVGHHPNLFQNTAYMTLLQNAIFWAAGQ
jgi:type 1 glutamine amidotransferase